MTRHARKRVRDFVAGKLPFVEEVKNEPALPWPEDLLENAQGGFQHHFHDSGTGIDRGCHEA